VYLPDYEEKIGFGEAATSMQETYHKAFEVSGKITLTAVTSESPEEQVRWRVRTLNTE
jgi:hypothetical protein